jgi:hypothetical protein
MTPRIEAEPILEFLPSGEMHTGRRVAVVANAEPRPECFTHGGDLLFNFDGCPLLRHVIVGIVTPLLRLNESVRDGSQTASHCFRCVLWGIILEGRVDL